MYMALTMMPTIRPKTAPTAIDGTKIPAGTLHPYESTIRRVLIMVASKSELTILHWEEDLQTSRLAGFGHTVVSSWTHWQRPE